MHYSRIQWKHTKFYQSYFDFSLYPVVSSTTREAIEDDNIEGLKIPAGTKIVLHFGALHRYFNALKNFVV